MRHELHTEITVDAPTEVVWEILIDLEGYADWNPFIIEGSGDVEVGERLVNRMRPPEGTAMTLRPTVTQVEQGRIFEWLGRLGMPGIFDGRHRFELRSNDDGTTTLDHSEYFRGILVRPMKKMVDTKTRDGFLAMNIALKDRAEARVRCSS